MRKNTFPYIQHRWSDYTDRLLIREFRGWRAWAATATDGTPVLLLDEYRRRIMTRCEYLSEEERCEDIRVLESIDEDIVSAALSPPVTGSSGAPAAAVLHLPAIIDLARPARRPKQ